MPSALLRDKNGLTEEEFLAAYRPKDYPRPSLTADIAVFSQEAGALQVLLVRRGGHPFLGKWALPGGFAQPGEAVTQTARRELEEETGLKGLRLTPVGLFSQPGRDPRMWVVSQAFAARIPSGRRKEAKAGDDAADTRWFRVSACPEGSHIQLRLTGAQEDFAVLLEDVTPPDCTEHEYRAKGDCALAFDHAAILYRAMETLAIL